MTVLKTSRPPLDLGLHTSSHAIGTMLHGLGYEVSDMGTDPSVRLVKALILGHGDTVQNLDTDMWTCLLYTSPSPRDGLLSRMPSSA